MSSTIFRACVFLAVLTRAFSFDLNPKSLTRVNPYYGSVVHDILMLQRDVFKHSSYKRLVKFLDKFGHRQAGSQNLEDAIDHLTKEMQREFVFESVTQEEVNVTKWIRNEESAYLLYPKRKRLHILGLGSSVATPSDGLVAPVLVVRSFQELRRRSVEARGKIVVFNQDYTDYMTTVPYRWKGASVAAKHGAVAALVRSITPASLQTPHTGQQRYEEGVRQIPVASISIEDAELLQRLQLTVENSSDPQARENFTIALKMTCETSSEPVISRNIVADLKGRQYPHEVVMLMAHLDSWDVGQGALDNGAGVFISLEAMRLIMAISKDTSKLGRTYTRLRPRRTVRLLLPTAEEIGLVGSKQYFNQHRDELGNITFVMESDHGVFKPQGVAFNGHPQSAEVMKKIMQLFDGVNATKMILDRNIGTDMSHWIKAGVAGAELKFSGRDHARYFHYHHTEADTVSALDPDDMDMCAALWASIAYIVADIEANFI